MTLRVLSMSAVAAFSVILMGCQSAPADNSAEPKKSESASPVLDDAYECMIDLGWNVTLADDGSITANQDTVAKEQLDVYNEAIGGCFADAEARYALEDSDLPGLYKAELATQECLAENGVAVTDPPTEQTFVDSFRANPWMAYSDIDTTTIEASEWKRLNDNCPQPLATFDGSFD